MLYLFGAGGHAKVVLETAEDLNIPIGGIIDENDKIKALFKYQVFNPKNIPPNFSDLIITVGDNVIRKKLVERFQQKNFISLIHPRAFLSKRSTIGFGSVIMAGVSVNSCATIGSHVIINTNASVDHDCVVGDYVHIAPNVSLAGGVIVGEGAYIGIGVCIRQGIKIGKWSIIGAGAVVVADISDFTTVYGNPARVPRKGKKINEGNI